MQKSEMTCWLTLFEVLEIVGVSRVTLDRWIKAGDFPEGYRHGKARRWAVHEVEAWLLSRRGEPTTSMDKALAGRAKARALATPLDTEAEVPGVKSRGQTNAAA